MAVSAGYSASRLRMMPLYGSTLVGTEGRGPYCTASSLTSRSSGEVAAVVTMDDQLRYEPAAVIISVGQAVRWANTSAVIHTVTADPSRAAQEANVRLPSGVDAFDSGDIGPGGSFTWTFTVPGEYRYICIPHEGAAMVGTIMVR